jgi:two-component system OmpR family response regulator
MSTSNEQTNQGQGTPPAEQRPKKRILVVDDEPTITRLLKLNLERTGDYEVRTENAATGALAAAEEFRPNLILLDVAMPGVDGGALAQRIQETPKLGHVPIVFLTALATKEEVLKSHGMIGGLPFLAKPVDMAEVQSCIRKHLAA